MLSKLVIKTQLEFYKRGDAGCLFAAHAASNPDKYEWRLSVSEVDVAQIESIVQDAMTLSSVSTQSIIFPSVIHVNELKELLDALQKTPSFFLDQNGVNERSMNLASIVARFRSRFPLPSDE